MSNSNNTMVPEAREAMNKFKQEAASEVGVNLQNGYNGQLTSREAGSIGGQMVNIICPGGHDETDTVSHEISRSYAKIYRYARINRRAYGHMTEAVYIVKFGD